MSTRPSARRLAPALAAAVVVPALVSCVHVVRNRPINPAAERAAVIATIHNNIGWAITRDTTLLYGTNAHDSTFFIYNPDSTSIRGYEAFRAVAKRAWLDTGFRGTRFEVKNLALNFSRSGTVAWFSALLDDYGVVGGREVGWTNCRWTGVLERQEDGRWAFVQMHFSFPR